MKPTYDDEVAHLPGTYALARSAPIEDISSLLDDIWGTSTVFVGSGGAYSTARFAASLHERFTGMPAEACTPLGFASRRAIRDSSVVLLSASGKHPDAATTAELARYRGCKTTGLLTLKEHSELPKTLAARLTNVATVPSAQAKDGFLATNSVLAMATLLARGYLGETALLPEPSLPPAKISAAPKHQRFIVLHDIAQSAAAHDFDVRVSETGIGTVQLADYRNFAHGRHLGLHRNRDATSVIAFVATSESGLADTTLNLIPENIDVVRLESTLPWPISTLSFLRASMEIVAPMLRAAGLNLARPGVPSFGRRLYNLRMRKHVLPAGRARTDRESGRLGMALATDYDPSEWVRDVRRQRFSGLVLDYDGTCCATTERFDLPRKEVQQQLLRLLDEGMVVAFASGRGSSLHRDLRQWVPGKHWHEVRLGLYNGGYILSLADEFDAHNLPVCADLREAMARVDSGWLSSLVTTKLRPIQLNLVPRTRVGIATLGTLVQEVVARDAHLDVKVLVSGHSVDVVPQSSSKATMVFEISRSSGETFAIGDQGQYGANDFELLASTRWSLSVDRSSNDDTRCLVLADSGIRGPELLLRYLRAFKSRPSGFRFDWRGR